LLNEKFEFVTTDEFSLPKKHPLRVFQERKLAQALKKLGKSNAAEFNTAERRKVRGQMSCRV